MRACVQTPAPVGAYWRMTLSSEYRDRLQSLYASYFGEWRRIFGMPGEAAQTPSERREQRWEGEGGRTVEADEDTPPTSARGPG